MLKTIGAAALAAALLATTAPAGADSGRPIKTRLDHLSGTTRIAVVSYLPAEITSITVDRWTLLGINSWDHQNDFTIPGGPAFAIVEAKGFDKYGKAQGSIVAHTDDGDVACNLDRGAGNWTDSTKLTCGKP